MGEGIIVRRGGGGGPPIIKKTIPMLRSWYSNSTRYIRSCDFDNKYICVGRDDGQVTIGSIMSETTHSVYISNSGAIYGVKIDGKYIYMAFYNSTSTRNFIQKYELIDSNNNISIELIGTSQLNVVGHFESFIVDNDYIYSAREGDFLRKFDKNTLDVVLYSEAFKTNQYTRGIDMDEEYIYLSSDISVAQGGAGSRIYKIRKSDFQIVGYTGQSLSLPQHLRIDGNFLYCKAGGNVIRKFNKVTMELVASSETFNQSISAISPSGKYIYIVRSAAVMIRLLKSTLEVDSGVYGVELPYAQVLSRSVNGVMGTSQRTGGGTQYHVPCIIADIK